MFKKATSRQLSSVAVLWIVLCQIAGGQDLWKGLPYFPEPLPVRKVEKAEVNSVLGKTIGLARVYRPTVKRNRFSDEKPTRPSLTFSVRKVEEVAPSSQSFVLPSGKQFTSLQRIHDSSLPPWRMQVKLFVVAANGQRFSCSGTLIDAYHVVTAAHCIYSVRKGGWARKVEVVPAYQEGEAPFGAAEMTEVLYWPDWISRQNYNDDVAVLRLDRPLGAVTGWMNFGSRTDTDFFKQHTFDNPGYPASSSFDGQWLYNWSGSFDFSYGQYLLYHNNRAYAGQSGSGAFFDHPGEGPTLYTVLSHGTPDPGALTGHLRLTEKKCRDIRTFIKKARSENLDLMPLFIQTNADRYTTDQQLDSLHFILYNRSHKVFEGPLTIEITLFDQQDEAFISSGKQLNPDALRGGEGRRISFAVPAWSWPEALTSGQYFLSVRLLIDDGNHENNLSSHSERKAIYVEKKEDPLFFELSTDEFLLPPGGGEAELSLRTNEHRYWRIEASADWVLVEPSRGQGSERISLTVAENRGGIDRTAILMVQAGEEKKNVHIVQSAVGTVDIVPLSPGWNLISLDVEPENPDLKEVTKSLSPGNLVQVNGLTDGVYQFFRPGYPVHLNTLAAVRKGAGYWVQVKYSDTLVVKGVPIPEDYRPELAPGRNLVAFVPQQPQRPEEFFGDWIEQGRLRYIITYKEGKSLRFEPGNLTANSLGWLENGLGYWVEIEPEKAALKIKKQIKPDHTRLGITHLAREKLFEVQFESRTKGTLLLMITDLFGRQVKTRSWRLESAGQAGAFQLDYDGFKAGHLVFALFWNQKCINSRVYLND